MLAVLNRNGVETFARVVRVDGARVVVDWLGVLVTFEGSAPIAARPARSRAWRELLLSRWTDDDGRDHTPD